MNIKIIEIQNENQIKQFHLFPQQIYRDNKYWIEPLHQDVEKYFAASSEYYKSGQIKRWLVYNAGTGEVLGRIAAFYHSQLRVGHKADLHNGGMGFFESIDDVNVAKLLLETAEAWLSYYNVQCVYGPINPFEKESFWGLLTEGFDLSPGFRKSYNPPYYQKLIEICGYEIDYKQFTFKRSLETGTPDHLNEKISLIKNNTDYTFQSIQKLKPKYYLAAIRSIYNDSWGKIPGYKPMSTEQIQSMFTKLKMILKPQYIWLASYKNQPAAFVIFVPEIGEFTQDMKGKFHWLNKIKLWLRIRNLTSEKITGLAFGVHPDHHSVGLAQALLSVSGEFIRATSKSDRGEIKEMELNWIGDFNKKMIALVQSFGATPSKTYITYKKSLV